MTPLQAYQTRGFYAPLQALTERQAVRHRRLLEAAERRVGPLHYRAKIHTILKSPYQLATHPVILDMVAEILGEDILLYDSAYIIKEPRSEAFVSWHQDLAYWGLDGDAQVSVWLALSAADEVSGCMRMLPGSHLHGQRAHDISHTDKNNVLLQSQRINDVDETAAVHCPLRPGQASLHHGWTLHCSAPNRGDARRIGYNIQYIAPHVRQTKSPGMSAMLVRGKDRFGYYEPEIPPRRNLEPAAMRERDRRDQLYRDTAGRPNN